MFNKVIDKLRNETVWRIVNKATNQVFPMMNLDALTLDEAKTLKGIRENDIEEYAVFLDMQDAVETYNKLLTEGK
jgi:hypothetical protein